MWNFGCDILFTTAVFCTGCKDKKLGVILRDMIQTDYFRVVVVDDVDTVEVCGALKVIKRNDLILQILITYANQKVFIIFFINL